MLMMNLDQFRKLPIMGILRGITDDAVEPLAETMISAGLMTVEIAMNTGGAPQLIKEMKKSAHGHLVVGAGTVLTKDDLSSALDAGAEFIVSPVLKYDVVECCVGHKIPVFPGALTPLEIYNAWCAGAAMVKIFPSKFLGPVYFKEIKGPFNDVELLACGGVTAENIGEFFDCGANGVAFGASIFRDGWLKEKNFSAIEKSIKEILTAFEAYRKEKMMQ